MLKQKKKEKKLCPLLDQECICTRCEMYEEKLDRCDISLIVYNLYTLTKALKQQSEDIQSPDLG